jgi:hypothetical protein
MFTVNVQLSTSLGCFSIFCAIDNYIYIYIYNIRTGTLSVNIKFICTSFRNRQNSEPLPSFSGLFRSEYKWILYLTIMYVYCVYPAMSKKSENLSDLSKKDRNKRHSSPFINVVKGVFFVVRVTLVPVSYLSVPSPVHSYRVPGKFIRIVRKVYSSSTNKAEIYSQSIFVQQMYWYQDKYMYRHAAGLVDWNMGNVIPRAGLKPP